MRVKLTKKEEILRYSLCPYRKQYDEFRDYWTPNLMFMHKKNHRSNVINTDILGLRFNDVGKKIKGSIFDIKKNKNSLLVGSSVVLGIGSSNDKNTISSFLSNNNENYYNLGVRAYNQFQEIILFLSIFYKLKKINKIVILSGMNDILLNYNKSMNKNFPGPIYWNNQFVNNMNNLSKQNNSLLNFFEFNQNISKNKTLNISLNEILLRNFSIWKLIEKSLNTKIYFILQPYLRWCKNYSVDEKKILDYTNLRSDNYIYKKVEKSYNKLRKLFKKTSESCGIKFYDSNAYLRENSTSKDFLFIDNVHLNDNGNKKIADFIKLISGRL